MTISSIETKRSPANGLTRTTRQWSRSITIGIISAACEIVVLNVARSTDVVISGMYSHPPSRTKSGAEAREGASAATVTTAGPGFTDCAIMKAGAPMRQASIKTVGMIPAGTAEPAVGGVLTGSGVAAAAVGG